MKSIFLVAILVLVSLRGICQDQTDSTMNNQNTVPICGCNYAYITVEGKAFSNRLKVTVDLGDLPDQVSTGKRYAEMLTNKKSYAAILNYMAEQQFDLIGSRDNNFSYHGTGGTDGVIFVMKKRIASDK